MAETRTINIDINEKSLKSQLRAAQQEVAALSDKFGATSQAAVDAAKRAAQLKDRIEDAKNMTDAFNPDAKFKALTQSLSGVLNGFQAFEGALGLVGVESEAVQESLLKVQSAMALAQGVDGVLEAVDSFKTLGAQLMKYSIVQKVVTAAQYVWNNVIKANPIGALTVAITGLIAAGYALIKMFQSSTAENERNAASIKRSTHELKKQNLELEKSATRLEKRNQFEYDYAKASGASAKELRKVALANAEEELALARKNKELAKSSYLREKDILASMRSRDASEEDIKKQSELVQKYGEAAREARETAQKEYEELKDLRNQQRIQIKQEQTDRINAQKENATQSVNTEKETQVELMDIRRQMEEEKNRLMDESREKDLDALRIKYKYEKEQADKNFKDGSLTKADYNKLTTQMTESQRIDEANVNTKWNKIDYDTFVQKEQERIELEDAQFEELQRLRNSKQEQEIADVVKAYEEKFALAGTNGELEKVLIEQQQKDINAITKKYKDEEIQAEKDKNEKIKAENLKSTQQRIDLALKYAQTFGQAMGSLNGLLNANDEARLKNVKKGSKEEEAIKRKMFERDKKLRIVQTVIDTASNVVQSVRNGGGIPAGIPFGIAAGAMGAMQIAAISKTKFEGGGEQVQSPSASVGSGAVAPNFNVVGSSGVNQLAQIQQQPTRAYVVSGDVASGLSLERNRLQNATL